MINSKGIKILCYITMGFMYIISFALFIYGIIMISDEFDFGWVLIIGSIIIPLIVTVSLYPIFAIANIDENTNEINEKLNIILKNNNQDINNNQDKNNNYQENIINNNEAKSNIKLENDFYDVKKINTNLNQDNLYEVINEIFEINTNSNEEIETIKNKIMNSDINDQMINILKKRISGCQTIKEIENSISIYLKLMN